MRFDGENSEFEAGPWPRIGFREGIPPSICKESGTNC
jgi:hypothetical protein